MKIYHFGAEDAPVLLLLPGTTPMRFTMPMMNPMILRKTQKAGT